jgi:hypothetical protein
MTRTFRTRAVLTILLAGLACLPLDASLIVPASLRTLSVEAQAIVLGRVIEVRAQMRPGRRRVDSYIVFAVDEALKGPERQTIVFKTLGGVSGRYRTVVPGSPVFKPGDEAVIFLGHGAVPYPIGLSHGVFRVRRDRLTGEPRILAPASLLDPDRRMTVRGPDGVRTPVSVETFAAMVRQAARRRP